VVVASILETPGNSGFERRRGVILEFRERPEQLLLFSRTLLQTSFIFLQFAAEKMLQRAQKFWRSSAHCDARSGRDGK
jgi:hypothetical protein